MQKILLVLSILIFASSVHAQEGVQPERLKTFLPDTLQGLSRSAITAERTGQVSIVRASYKDSNGTNIEVEITDIGPAKGAVAVSGLAGVETASGSINGFEKTYTKGTEPVHEQWDRRTSSGEYITILGDRFNIKASGKAADINTLKNAVSNINLAGLAALKD
jgi:hypothetical protein